MRSSNSVLGILGMVLTAAWLWSLAPTAHESLVAPQLQTSPAPESPGPRQQLARQEPQMPPLPSQESRSLEKARLASYAEATRIAERERRLDTLDWTAPRPNPSPQDQRVLSKSERALPPGNRAQQLALIAKRIQQRIEILEHPRSGERASAFGRDTPEGIALLERMRRRLGELAAERDTLLLTERAPQPK
ncbi:MAG TPA: hypothetical protein VFQ61_31535 [Polyangiaceae bacterium]|nr:hypothetical protein [Polyangiaceae bacterium]